MRMLSRPQITIDFFTSNPTPELSLSLASVALGAMVTAVSDGIVATYETFLEDCCDTNVDNDDARHPTVTQNRALQMLFDLKYVTKIFPRKEDDQVFISHTTLIGSSCYIPFYEYCCIFPTMNIFSQNFGHQGASICPYIFYYLNIFMEIYHFEC